LSRIFDTSNPSSLSLTFIGLDLRSIEKYEIITKDKMTLEVHDLGQTMILRDE